MKKHLLFCLSVFLLFSCNNEPPVPEDPVTPTPEKQETNLIGKEYILSGSLFSGNWYIPNPSNDTQYFSFSTSTINYRFSYNPMSPFYGLGSSKTGKLTFLTPDSSEFEYRWDGSISGSERKEKILILDADILVLKNGFECTNSSGSSNVCYKNLDAYNDDVPFMGLGQTTQNNYNEWFIFTPSGICYKRYLDLSKNELLILNGTWEKIENQTYRIYWFKNNKDRYDLLKGTKLYQDASENTSTVPISLYVTDH